MTELPTTTAVEAPGWAAERRTGSGSSDRLTPATEAVSEALSPVAGEAAELVKSVIELDRLWPSLNTSVGSPGIGQPSHKSRPPATLSVVALVMEVSGAAIECVKELTGKFNREPMVNLRIIAAYLQRQPVVDLIEWWTAAVADWLRRARLLLGYQPVLPHQQYGAACPYCSMSVAVVHEAGEAWRVPAIGLTWIEHEYESWQLQSVYCRNCGAEWVRGIDLDQMVTAVLDTQRRESLSEYD